MPTRCFGNFLAMAKSALLHGQICFATWPNGVAPCATKGLGVITVACWRQLVTVLASSCKSIDANTHGWPHGENFWPQENSRLATGGKRFGHMTDRSFPGVGRDFGTPRKGFSPLPEKCGVLSPRAAHVKIPRRGAGEGYSRETVLT